MVSATPRGPPGVRSRGLSIFNLNLDCRGGGESEKFSSRSTTRKEKSRPSDQPLGKPGRRTPKMPGQRLLFGAPNITPKVARNSLTNVLGMTRSRWRKYSSSQNDHQHRELVLSYPSQNRGSRKGEREIFRSVPKKREEEAERELGVENHWHTKQTAL